MGILNNKGLIMTFDKQNIPTYHFLMKNISDTRAWKKNQEKACWVCCSIHPDFT